MVVKDQDLSADQILLLTDRYSAARIRVIQGSFVSCILFARVTTLTWVNSYNTYNV